MRKLMFLIVLISAVACGEIATDPEKARTAAETMGWSDVTVKGRHGIAPTLYGCSKEDVVAYDIDGKNPRGQQASATMCCGWPLKGCTMRVD